MILQLHSLPIRNPDKMNERIRQALESHAGDPSGAAESLRSLLHENQPKFVRSAALLRSDLDKPDFQPLIVVLAQSTALSDQLCDPDLLDKQSGIDLTQRIAAISPGVDATLVRLLPARGSDSSDAVKILRAERILELLEALAGSARVSPMLAHLTNHPNARLQAKVSMLMARWTPNLRKAEKNLEGDNARLRANAVESLWGDKTNRTSSLLWRRRQGRQ